MGSEAGTGGKKIDVGRVEHVSKPLRVYLLEKAEEEMLDISRQSYYDNPSARGKEFAFNLLGIVHEVDGHEFRIVTEIGYGDVIGSPEGVINPAETIDEIDSRAREKGLSVLGVAHLHPFRRGHRRLSGTDIDTMRAYGTLDPGYIFVVVNPRSLSYSTYYYDVREDRPVKIKSGIVRMTSEALRAKGDEFFAGLSKEDQTVTMELEEPGPRVYIELDPGLPVPFLGIDLDEDDE